VLIPLVAPQTYPYSAIKKPSVLKLHSGFGVAQTDGNVIISLFWAVLFLGFYQCGSLYKSNSIKGVEQPQFFACQAPQIVVLLSTKF
jgi:hypothetical protein